MTDRLHTQTILHDPERGVEGNCCQAAFASYLGLPLQAVPDFNTRHQHAEHTGYFWDDVRRWFLGQGYLLQMMDKTYAADVLYLASGPSPRGVDHMVVYRAGELFWDPHPSRAGIARVKNVWVAVPVDPLKFARTS